MLFQKTNPQLHECTLPRQQHTYWANSPKGNKSKYLCYRDIYYIHFSKFYSCTCHTPEFCRPPVQCYSLYTALCKYSTKVPLCFARSSSLFVIVCLSRHVKFVLLLLRFLPLVFGLPTRGWRYGSAFESLSPRHLVTHMVDIVKRFILRLDVFLILKKKKMFSWPNITTWLG